MDREKILVGKTCNIVCLRYDIWRTNICCCFSFINRARLFTPIFTNLQKYVTSLFSNSCGSIEYQTLIFWWLLHISFFFSKTASKCVHLQIDSLLKTNIYFHIQQNIRYYLLDDQQGFKKVQIDNIVIYVNCTRYDTNGIYSTPKSWYISFWRDPLEVMRNFNRNETEKSSGRCSIEVNFFLKKCFLRTAL